MIFNGYLLEYLKDLVSDVRNLYSFSILMSLTCVMYCIRDRIKPYLKKLSCSAPVFCILA